ncbi:hypothetical protein [Methanothrix soehngenii]|uniref:hypothetical protein n=1 Tax=Methanothrix soehngenii TaxID=2223 RepID=UPI003AB9A06A
MVAAVEYLGADSLVTCRLGNAARRARRPAASGLAAAASAWLVTGRAQHLFESDGTRRADAERNEAATMFA